MKNKILLLIAVLTTSFSTFAQSPESFNYQAVIRDASNVILANQAVGIQFRLLQGSPTGTVVYTETHSPTTDTYGLVALAIGTGTTSDDFSTIDWANGPYFLEIAADITGGTSYNVLGTQQLMSVPYALYAKTSGSTAPANQITDTDNDTKIQVEATPDEDIIRFDVAGTEKTTLDSNGLGIGTTTPSATLDIVGTLQYVDGNQATDQVLVSDADGNATWQAMTSLPVYADLNMAATGDPLDCLTLSSETALPFFHPLIGYLVENTTLYIFGQAITLGIPEYSLTLYNISDPNNAVLISTLPLPFTSNVLSFSKPIKAGNNLYLASPGFLNAVDVTDPANPVLLDSFAISGETNPIIHYHNNRVFYAGANDTNLLQFDVSDPSNITALPNFTKVNSSDPFLSFDIDGDRLYYTDFSSGFPLHIFDISSPTEQFLGTSTVTSFINELMLVEDGYCYVNDVSSGYTLRIVDVTDPTNTQLVGSVSSALINNTNTSIVKSGDLLMQYSRDATGFEVIDISTPANPINLGEQFTAEIDGNFNQALQIDNGLLYAYSNVTQELVVIDLSCPAVNVSYNPATGLFEAVEDLDEQTLSVSGSNLSISNGNTVDLSGIGVGLDEQTLSISGSDLTITGGNTVDLNGIDTDEQTLSISGSDLTIAGGNTLDISSVDTDEQTLSLSGSNLTISGGNTLDISGIDTDTDDQTLSFSGENLVISEGNSVDLSTVAIVNRTVNNQTTGQSASIDIQGSLEVGQTIKTFGNVELAANSGSTVSIGNGGTALTIIIKVDVSMNVGSISTDGMLNVDFAVPGAQIGSSVIVSPSIDLPNQVFIGQARVNAAGVVRVRFHNESDNTRNPVDMIYYITVIK